MRIRPCWKDQLRAESISAEFRADVIAVACKGEAPRRQIAKDFGISEACLYRWLKMAGCEDGADRARSPVGRDESEELTKPASGSSWSNRMPR